VKAEKISQKVLFYWTPHPKSKSKLRYSKRKIKQRKIHYLLPYPPISADVTDNFPKLRLNAPLSIDIRWQTIPEWRTMWTFGSIYTQVYSWKLDFWLWTLCCWQNCVFKLKNWQKKMFFENLQWTNMKTYRGESDWRFF
jgi:hypothetical protein